MEKLRRKTFAGDGLWARIGFSGGGKLATATGAVVLGAAAGYAAYRSAGAAVGLVGRVRKWWGARPDPVVPAVSDRAAVYVPESARPGSEERHLTAPKCQALVGYMEGGTFCVLGNAARIDDWLLIPDHVRSGKSESLELRSFDQKHRLELDSDLLDAMFVVDTDLWALELTQAQWSKIALSRSRLLPSIPEERGVYVSVVGAFGKGTTGNLAHHTVFGRVHYTGSTYQGYSGAVYMSGDCIAGIHTHGGSFNGGYSASYALSLLKYLRKRREAGEAGKVVYESSDDWLEEQRDKGAEIQFDSKWHDMDEVRIRVDGRYHVVARESMAKTFGGRWQSELTGGRGRRAKYWEDPEAYLSGEDLASLPGASDSSTVKAPSDVVSQKRSKPSVHSRQRKQLRELKEQLRQLQQQQAATS